MARTCSINLVLLCCWAVLVMVLGGGSSLAQDDGTTVTLTPLTLDMGESGIVEGRITCAAEDGCSAFDITITFDPAIVRVDGAEVGTYLGDTVFVAENVIDQEAGTVRLAAAVMGAMPRPESSVLLTLDVTALKDGISDLAITGLDVADAVGNPLVAAGIAGRVLVGSAEALDSVPISYGLAIVEAIEVPGDEDRYVFQGRAGDVVVVTASGTEDAPWLSLEFEIRDPGGEPVPEGERERYPLPADGPYTLVLHEAGTRTGPYTLTIQNMAQGAGTRLAYGDVVEAAIDVTGEEDFYHFEAHANDSLLLTLSRRGDVPQLNLVIELIDPQGSTLAHKDTWVSSTVLIDETLAVAGTYSIKVWITGQFNTPQTGAYACLIKNLADATPIAYGDTVEGEIVPEGDRDVYVFEWHAGEVPVIEAATAQLEGHTGGHFFELLVEVFDSEGNSLAMQANRDQVRIKPLLYADGLYTIVLREQEEISGFSVGAYVFTLRNDVAQ